MQTQYGATWVAGRLQKTRGARTGYGATLWTPGLFLARMHRRSDVSKCARGLKVHIVKEALVISMHSTVKVEKIMGRRQRSSPDSGFRCDVRTMHGGIEGVPLQTIDGCIQNRRVFNRGCYRIIRFESLVGVHAALLFQNESIWSSVISGQLFLN